MKELVLSINEKAPIATLLLKSPITSLKSIFCIIGSIILLVAMCIFEDTCQTGKKECSTIGTTSHLCS